jgi:hypothetical protein
VATAADFNALCATKNMSALTGVESPPGVLQVLFQGAPLTIPDRGDVSVQIPVQLHVDRAFEIINGFPAMPNMNAATILKPIITQVFRAFTIGLESR